MEKILEGLRKFDFSKMESKVYISLLKYPKINGSQMAKILKVPRSSVYLALEGLSEKGAVYSMPGTTNVYQAEKPEKLFDRLRQNYFDTAKLLKDELSKFEKVDDNNNAYFNIEGLENTKAKIKELIKSAEKEIYLNTNIDLDFLKKELKEVQKRGVRLISFSFGNTKNTPDFMESYISKKFDFSESSYKKIFLVADRRKVFIASCEGENCSGTFSENELLVKLVSDHIHHDIYLYRLEEKYGKDLIEDDIKIDTMHENSCVREHS